MPIVVQAKLNGDKIVRIRLDDSDTGDALYRYLCSRLKAGQARLDVRRQDSAKSSVPEVHAGSNASIGTFLSCGDVLVVTKAGEKPSSPGDGAGVAAPSSRPGQKQPGKKRPGTNDSDSSDEVVDMSDEDSHAPASARPRARPARASAVAARETFVEANRAIDALEAEEKGTGKKGCRKRGRQAGAGLHGAAELLRGALHTEGRRNARKLTGGGSPAATGKKRGRGKAASGTFGGAAKAVSSSSSGPSSSPSPGSSAGVSAAALEALAEGRRKRRLQALQARSQQQQQAGSPMSAAAGNSLPPSSSSPGVGPAAGPGQSASAQAPSADSMASASSSASSSSSAVAAAPRLPRPSVSEAHRNALHDAMLQEAVPSAAAAIERRHAASGDATETTRRASASHRAAVASLVSMTKSYVQTQYAINVASDRYAAALGRSYVVVQGGASYSDLRTPGTVLYVFPAAASAASGGSRPGGEQSAGGRQLGSGRMRTVRVRFPRKTSGHRCRWLEDVVEVTPPAVVVQVLEHALEHDSAADLRLQHLAEVSPRLFWGVVLSTTCKAQDALASLLPGRDVTSADRRVGRLSAKALANAEQGMLPPGHERAAKRRRVGADAVNLVSDSESSDGAGGEGGRPMLEGEEEQEQEQDGVVDLTGPPARATLQGASGAQGDSSQAPRGIDPRRSGGEELPDDEEQQVQGTNPAQEALFDTGSTAAWLAALGLPASAGYMPIPATVLRSVPQGDAIARALLDVQGMRNDLAMHAVLSQLVLEDSWPEGDRPQGNAEALGEDLQWKPVGSPSAGWTLEAVCDPDLASMLRDMGVGELQLANASSQGLLRAAAQGGTVACRSAVQAAVTKDTSDPMVALVGCCVALLALPDDDEDEDEEDDEDVEEVAKGSQAPSSGAPASSSSSSSSSIDRVLRPLHQWMGSQRSKDVASLVLAACPRTVALALEAAETVQETLQARLSEQFTRDACALAARSRPGAGSTLAVECSLRGLLGELSLAAGESASMSEELLGTAVEESLGKVPSVGSAASKPKGSAVAAELLRVARAGIVAMPWLKDFSHQDQWVGLEWPQES